MLGLCNWCVRRSHIMLLIAKKCWEGKQKWADRRKPVYARSIGALVTLAKILNEGRRKANIARDNATRNSDLHIFSEKDTKTQHKHIPCRYPLFSPLPTVLSREKGDYTGSFQTSEVQRSRRWGTKHNRTMFRCHCTRIMVNYDISRDSGEIEKY